MRLRPAARRFIARQGRDAAFIAHSRLSGMVLRMITLNSLSAFAQEISRRPPPEAVGGVTPAAAPAGRTATAGPLPEITPSQRTLDAAPSGPAPSRPLPRGSLLDLRV